MQQDRGLPAALSSLGVAVLAGLLVVVAPQLGATAATAALTPHSPSEAPHEYGAGPPVDLSADDDETVRDLKDRMIDPIGAAVSYRPLADFFYAPNPAADLVPAGRIAFSLGPRAPPHARNFDRRRLAWQA